MFPQTGNKVLYNAINFHTATPYTKYTNNFKTALCCAVTVSANVYATIKRLRWHGNAHFDRIALGLFYLRAHHFSAIALRQQITNNCACCQ